MSEETAWDKMEREDWRAASVPPDPLLARLEMDPHGCHKQVSLWLEAGKYRLIIHRHDGTFIAADESARLMMRADTLPLLADSLLNWPQDAESIPPGQWVKLDEIRSPLLAQLEEMAREADALAQETWAADRDPVDHLHDLEALRRVIALVKEDGTL